MVKFGSFDEIGAAFKKDIKVVSKEFVGSADDLKVIKKLDSKESITPDEIKAMSNDGRSALFHELDNISDISKVDKSLKDTYDAFGKVNYTAEDLVKMSGKNTSQVNEVFSKAKAWYADPANKENVALLIKAGFVVGGVAALMILTGNSDPFKAAGQAAGEVIGGVADAAGDAVGDATKQILDASGFTDFLAKWWWIFAIICCLVLSAGVYSVLK